MKKCRRMRFAYSTFRIPHLPSQRHYFAGVPGRGEFFVQFALLVLVAAFDDELEQCRNGYFARPTNAAFRFHGGRVFYVVAHGRLHISIAADVYPRRKG